jgi:hypothetical protein
MPDQRARVCRETYLVEHYRPGQNVDEVQRSLARVRETVMEMEREGKRIRHLRSTIVPDDESYLSVLDAESEELVREAYARADIPFERISTAIADEQQGAAERGQ